MALFPEPIYCTSGAILMEYIGDESVAAPQLQAVRLDREAAEAAADRILWNIETMLDNHKIHGDLSAFNILYWQDRPIIIDLPQAVDPRQNRHARELLARDIENVARHFRRLGVEIDERRVTNDLCERFRFGELG